MGTRAWEGIIGGQAFWAGVVSLVCARSWCRSARSPRTLWGPGRLQRSSVSLGRTGLRPLGFGWGRVLRVRSFVMSIDPLASYLLDTPSAPALQGALRSHRCAPAWLWLWSCPSCVRAFVMSIGPLASHPLGSRSAPALLAVPRSHWPAPAWLWLWSCPSCARVASRQEVRWPSRSGRETCSAQPLASETPGSATRRQTRGAARKSEGCVAGAC